MLRIPGKAWTISMVLFIVNCGLKVGNSFLYIFSRFLSFTEILDTFDFLCLWFFSLTDLFLCASETKTQQQQGGFLFFQTTRKHFWNVVNTNWLPRRKLHLSQEKSVRRKMLDIAAHCSSPSGLLLHYHWYYVLKLKLPWCIIIKHLQLLK